MDRGKVVLVPFPFDDLSFSKLRPAVCLTEPMGPHRHIVVAFITSRIPPDLLDSDLILDAQQADFSQTDLYATSTLRLHRLMTVSSSLIQRELGNLPPEAATEVASKLKKLFDFA
ncbi:MAG: type II toxin-antitoxin system PemK/MazF family toxin [Armatimonadetes bacterium]|nr:type II toxin-antitoxin system PemK/MazF family toxin [Armatimonadota bacterium]